MNTKADFNKKVMEIMEILYEPVWHYRLTNSATSEVYEKKLNRIAEKCVNLNSMKDNSKLSEVA